MLGSRRRRESRRHVRVEKKRRVEEIKIQRESEARVGDYGHLGEESGGRRKGETRRLGPEGNLGDSPS